MVAVGEAHVFQVVVLAPGADALLRGRRPVVGALLQTEEDIFELVHAGVGEQQRGIVVRHQRGGVHALVSLGFEVAQEHFADFRAGGHE